jgi:hypothetical protein
MDEFMNTYEEIHAAWYGFGDSLVWARHPTEAIEDECRQEPHYYRLGYLAGKLMQATLYVFIGLLLTKVMFLW